MSVSIHFPRFHLKWVPVTPFSPIPLEILSLLKQSQGLTMVSLDRMNNWWWFGFVLHSHLKWLNQATRIIYSFKKYICGHPTGMVAIAFQSLGTCGLMTAAARVLRPPWADERVNWLMQVDGPKVPGWPGALAWGAFRGHCCFHGASAHLLTW